MGSIEVFCRFQLEAIKLGREVIFLVTVFEKNERGRRRLFAETQCSDALQFLLQFVIRDAKDLDGVVERFVRQLVHRGFDPLQYRVQTETGSWEDWIPLEILEVVEEP